MARYFVRVKLTSDRPRETLRELTGDAGFDPKVEDAEWLVWSFSTRERADFFANTTRYTTGVSLVECVMRAS